MPLNPTTSNNTGRPAIIKNPILVENKHNPLQHKNTNNSIVSNGEIQGIEEYLTLISSSDSESDHESRLQQIKPKSQLPSWAQSPILKETLKKQQAIDPDSIFEELEQPNIQGLYASD